jgi:hypothetical protein
MSGTDAAAALRNARYIAIRTAEAKGLTDRLLEATRDRTPGIRRLLVPLLYRYWYANRDKGWELIERIAGRAVRFPGLVDRSAVEILGEISMPILHISREEPEALARLLAIWRTLFARILGSPLAMMARLLGRNFVLRRIANSFAGVMQQQPDYQPVNHQELVATFALPDEARVAWRRALECLEQPAGRPDAIEAILMQTDRPFDLYLMLVCERALICHGARTDPAYILDMAERIFHDGCRWFRHSLLYVLYHAFDHRTDIEDGWLERYEALALEFFVSGSWRLVTGAGRYAMPGHVANPDVVAARRRPGRAPRVVPALLQRAIAAGDEAEIAALFAAIDGVGFYHAEGELALALIEKAQELGGSSVEHRVVTALAGVRVLDQPLIDAVLDQRRMFPRITLSEVAEAEPTIVEEDLLTLVDGFVIHMMISSDEAREQLCLLFRRALGARGATECLLQLLEWTRDRLGVSRSRSAD